MDISTFMVHTCPATVLYIPNFITAAEETAILNAVANAPKPKWEQLSNRRLINYGGVPHANGMLAEKMPDWLQAHMNKVEMLGAFDKHRPNHVLVNEYLPGQGIMPHTDGPLFHPIISTISCGSHTVLEFTVRPESGTASASAALTPSTSSSSLLSVPSVETTVPPKPRTAANQRKLSATAAGFKLLVEPRSLLILQDDVYHRYLHAIAERHEDRITDDIQNLAHCGVDHPFGERLQREKRVSLTIRHVPKTTKMSIFRGR